MLCIFAMAYLVQDSLNLGYAMAVGDCEQPKCSVEPGNWCSTWAWDADFGCRNRGAMTLRLNTRAHQPQYNIADYSAVSPLSGEPFYVDPESLPNAGETRMAILMVVSSDDMHALGGVVVETWHHVVGKESAGSKRRAHCHISTEKERKKIGSWKALYWKMGSCGQGILRGRHHDRRHLQSAAARGRLFANRRPQGVNTMFLKDATFGERQRPQRPSLGQGQLPGADARRENRGTWPRGPGTPVRALV